MKKDHDHAYKLLSSEPKMIVDLLQGFVHKDWVKELDFSIIRFKSFHTIRLLP